MQKEQIIRDAEQLKLTLESSGWKTVIKPILDKMIQDCVGYSLNGRWVAGEIQRRPEKAEGLANYVSSLIELDQRIQDVLSLAEKIKEEERKPIKETLEVAPLQDTRYR